MPNPASMKRGWFRMLSVNRQCNGTNEEPPSRPSTQNLRWRLHDAPSLCKPRNELSSTVIRIDRSTAATSLPKQRDPATNQQKMPTCAVLERSVGCCYVVARHKAFPARTQYGTDVSEHWLALFCRDLHGQASILAKTAPPARFFSISRTRSGEWKLWVCLVDCSCDSLGNNCSGSCPTESEIEKWQRRKSIRPRQCVIT